MTKHEELPDTTVADMNVEGMPWNSRRPWQLMPGDVSKRKNRFHAEKAAGTEEMEPMSRKERRVWIFAALKASLLIGLAFGAIGFLFIMFCIYIWF